jgi:ribosomal protein S18 acetylase RimI-like enzyme
MIKYKPLIYNKDAIIELYLDNEWYAYTNKKRLLFNGIKNSLDVIGAYDEELLVGLIRTVGDANTIIYIQDILVLKKYQRQGIGTNLLTQIIDKYDQVRQIILTTDNTEKTKKFYESLGLISYQKIDAVGFMVKK